MTPTLIVLAAGLGSRYGGLKQMDPVGPSGEFILDYSVYDARRAGFGKVVFVVSEAIEAPFRETIGARLARHLPVAYVLQRLSDLPAGFAVPAERRKPWGTGHAVLCCRDAVQEPFAVINGDDFYGRASYAVLAQFLRDTQGQPNRHAMVGFVLRNTLSEHGHVARGICSADAAGNLCSVVERTRIEPQAGGVRYLGDDQQWQPLTGDEPVSMNQWGFKPSLFAPLAAGFEAFLRAAGADPKAEFFLPSLVNELIRSGAASAALLRTDASWFGVTYPQDKPRVTSRIRELIARGDYPENLWA